MMTREAFVAGVELMKSGDQAERLRGIARKLRPHDARLADLHEAEAQVVEMNATALPGGLPVSESRPSRAYLLNQETALRARLDEFPAPSAEETVKLETALVDVLRQLGEVGE